MVQGARLQTAGGDEQVASADSSSGDDTADQQDAANKFNAAYSDASQRDNNLEQQSMLPLFDAPDSPTAEPLIMASCMQFQSDKQTMAEQLPLMSDEARELYGNSELNEVSGYYSTWSAKLHELRQSSSQFNDPRNGAWGPDGFSG